MNTATHRELPQAKVMELLPVALAGAGRGNKQHMDNVAAEQGSTL